jgi:hypothetical protein
MMVSSAASTTQRSVTADASGVQHVHQQTRHELAVLHISRSPYFQLL